MKVIVSHDVDHLFLAEHWKDRFIPGLLYRSIKEVLSGDLKVIELARRFSINLNRIKELAAYNDSIGIPSSFFFGMSNGLRLSYSVKQAEPFIEYLVQRNIEVGLHGISYNSFQAMRKEKEELERILKNPVSGIRNHYLRQDSSTKEIMRRLRYKYDSTDMKLSNPYVDHQLWEIPISVMDVEVIKQGLSNQQVYSNTWKLVEKAAKNEQQYFVINFHDIYFNKSAYPKHYSWYTNLVENLLIEGYVFTDFRNAYNELISKAPE